MIPAVAGCGSGRNAYVQKNQELLHSLPLVPNSTQVRITSASYRESEHDPISGYTTNVVYRVSAALTPQDVIDFYVERLTPEWTYQRGEVPISSGGVVLLASFARGEAGVEVNTDGILLEHTYELSIDHRRTR